MQIISHRGYWKDFGKESNKKIAFERSFDLGFGTETDLRDCCGKIVVSHDMPNGDEITFSQFLEIMCGKNLPLALNIKADGLIDEILKILEQFNHTNYFTFDMSIPEMVSQMAKSANVFTGMSDILRQPVLLQKAKGVWLDSFFEPCWFGEEVVFDLLKQNKMVCIVSEDLHSRQAENQWTKLKGFSFVDDIRLFLCTNFPEEARKFFGSGK